MDFRTCPACNASVLEDDVEDCPFCGASMSGKPKPKSAAPATPSKPGPVGKSAAAPSEPTKKPGVKKAAAAPAAKSQSAEDDPFDIDTTALRKAIKLSPRPTKSRTYEVICPMCETVGYLPPEMAGKDVQCSNPECIVPVFKSKRPKIEKEEVAPKGNFGIILTVVSAAIVIVVAVIYQSVFNKPKNDEIVISPPVPTTCADCEQPVDPGTTQENVPKGPTLEDFRNEARQLVVKKATDRQDNRSPDFGTQFASEALAVSGEIAKAQDQLKRLQATARNAPHLQVLPMTEIGWAQLGQGDRAAALQSATDALAKAKALPQTVRQSSSAAILLAGLLLALEKPDEAAGLLGDQKVTHWRATTATVSRAAIDSRTFQVDLEAARPYHIAMSEPLQVGVVNLLVAREQFETAFGFANALSNSATKDACFAAWAGRLCDVQGEQAVATITQKLQSTQLSPVGQTRGWAAAAAHLYQHELSEAAGIALQNAVQAAQGIPSPPPSSGLSIKSISESQSQPNLGLGDTLSLRSAASAYTDLALVSAQAGNTNDVAQFLELAMQQARGMSPSPAKTHALVDECNNQEASVKSQLNAALNLRNNDSQIRNRFIDYRRQCGKLNDVANERLDFQVQLLRAAARQGLVSEVWRITKIAASETDLAKQETYFETSLPGYLEIQAKQQGLDAIRQEIATSIQETRQYSYDLVDQHISQFEDQIRDGKIKAAANQLQMLYRMTSDRSLIDKIDGDRLDLIALAHTSKLQRSLSQADFITFIPETLDKLFKEDAMLMFGGYVAHQNKLAELWGLMKSDVARELGALEVTAMYRGVLIELAHRSATVSAPAVESKQASVQ